MRFTSLPVWFSSPYESRGGHAIWFIWGGLGVLVPGLSSLSTWAKLCYFRVPFPYPALGFALGNWPWRMCCDIAGLPGAMKALNWHQCLNCGAVIYSAYPGSYTVVLVMLYFLYIKNNCNTTIPKVVFLQGDILGYYSGGWAWTFQIVLWLWRFASLSFHGCFWVSVPKWGIYVHQVCFDQKHNAPVISADYFLAALQINYFYFQT